MHSEPLVQITDGALRGQALANGGFCFAGIRSPLLWWLLRTSVRIVDEITLDCFICPGVVAAMDKGMQAHFVHLPPFMQKQRSSSSLSVRDGGETVEDVINVLGPYIAHVHVKDARRVPGNADWQLVLVGEGEVPVREQLKALVQHGIEKGRN